MTTTASLTKEEVEKLVTDWYLALDVHAPVDQYLPMLAEDGLEMQFPEATLKGQDAFKGWYDTVTHKFFDEVHTMKALDIRPSGDKADVDLTVNWQAKVWNPPEAKSIWLGFDAVQKWVVQRSPKSGKPVILTYIVVALNPMEGSASL